MWLCVAGGSAINHVGQPCSVVRLFDEADFHQLLDLLSCGHTLFFPHLSFFLSFWLGFFVNREMMCNKIQAQPGHIGNCPSKQISVINQGLSYQLAIVRF